MSVKLRLQRLEDSRKATADAVSSEITRGQVRQWIDDMTKSIQQGTPKPQFPEIDMTGYSHKQLEANASAKAWLEEQLSEHEQSKKPIT